jgi:hypothetical protein
MSEIKVRDEEKIRVLRGWMMGLIAYAGQNIYLTRHRVFHKGKEVEWNEYIRYVQREFLLETDCLNAFIKFSTERWIKENIMIRLLLQTKFEMEIGFQWKQFPTMVFSHLEFREMPSKLLIGPFRAVRCEVIEIIFERFSQDIDLFFQWYSQDYSLKFFRMTIRSALLNEPVYPNLNLLFELVANCLKTGETPVHAPKLKRRW